jgi:hypothetical protein
MTIHSFSLALLCFGFPLFPVHNLTCHTGVHVAHHVIKLVFSQTRRRDVGATPADRFFRLRVCATESARGANVDAAAALAALFRFNVEGRPNTAILSASAEADGFGDHLLFTHANAQAAENAVFVLLLEPLHPYVVSGRDILDHLGLGT